MAEDSYVVLEKTGIHLPFCLRSVSPCLSKITVFLNAPLTVCVWYYCWILYFCLWATLACSLLISCLPACPFTLVPNSSSVFWHTFYDASGAPTADFQHFHHMCSVLFGECHGPTGHLRIFLVCCELILVVFLEDSDLWMEADEKYVGCSTATPQRHK